MAIDVLAIAVSGASRGRVGVKTVQVAAHKVWKPPHPGDSRLSDWLPYPLPLVLVAAASYCH